MNINVELVFGIKITCKNDVIFYAYLWREHEISAILISTSLTISIEMALIMTGYHDDEQTCKNALELEWSLKKEPMMPLEACSVGKAKQLAINKYVDNSKQKNMLRF